MEQGLEKITTDNSLPNVETVTATTPCEGAIYDVLGRRLERIPKNTSLLRMKSGVITSKWCVGCLAYCPIQDFQLRPNNRYSEKCRECQQKEYRKERNSLNLSKRKYRKFRRDKDGLILWQCAHCRKFKYPQDFYKKMGKPQHINYVCIDCVKNNKQQTRISNGK